MTHHQRKPLILGIGLLTLALLGSAFAQPSIKDNVLAGKIVDWPAGKTGTVDVPGFKTVVSAPVATDGTFTLTLPDPASLNDPLPPVTNLFTDHSTYADGGCTGTGTVTPATSAFGTFNIQVSIDGDTATDLQLNDNNRLPTPTGQRFGVLYNFAEATSLDGTEVCATARFTDTLKGDFPAGWSLASGAITQISADQSVTETITSDALPEAVTFHLYYTLVGVGIKLDPPTGAGTGLVVSGVTPGKPAELAGVQLGDVVVQVDGKDVTALTQDQVLNLIRGDTPGTTVVIGVSRNGDTTILPITIQRVLFTTR